MLRLGTAVVIENEGHVYSIVDATRDQVELGDVLSWVQVGGEMNCVNETRGTNFLSRVREQDVPAAKIGSRLSAVLN